MIRQERSGNVSHRKDKALAHRIGKRKHTTNKGKQKITKIRDTYS